MSYTLLVGHQVFDLGNGPLTLGDPIPEADFWPHIEAYINLGEVFCLVEDRRDVPPGVDPTGPYVFTSMEDIEAEMVKGKFAGAVGGIDPAAVMASAEAPADDLLPKPKASTRKAPAKRATKKKA